MTTMIEAFHNNDGTFSHYSLCEINDAGDIEELTTTIMHQSFEDAIQELMELTNGGER